jgi:hypothetical protein
LLQVYVIPRGCGSPPHARADKPAAAAIIALAKTKQRRIVDLAIADR